MLIELEQGQHPMWRRIAGAALALTGIGHLGTELFAPSTPERIAMMTTLRALRVELPGANRSVEDLLLGFSFVMGVLLIGCGALVATARPTRWSMVTAALLTLGTSVLAWRYLFVVPGVLTSIAAAAALKAAAGVSRRVA
jgi:hypothetical protein